MFLMTRGLDGCPLTIIYIYEYNLEAKSSGEEYMKIRREVISDIVQTG